MALILPARLICPSADRDRWSRAQRPWKISPHDRALFEFIYHFGSVLKFMCAFLLIVSTPKVIQKKNVTITVSWSKRMYRCVEILSRTTLTGCCGECIKLRGQPVFMYGTLFICFEYALFCVICVGGVYKSPPNISICGYLELLPNWVAFLYFQVASSGIDSTLWHAAITLKQEPRPFLAILQCALGLSCATTLFGFSILPRCLWDWHQECVLAWVSLTSAAMSINIARDYRNLDYTAFPAALWILGIFFCNFFYHESTLRFFFAEALSVISYILWCSSNHRQLDREFTIFHVLIIDGFLATIFLGLFRYHQRVACVVTGKW